MTWTSPLPAHSTANKCGYERTTSTPRRESSSESVEVSDSGANPTNRATGASASDGQSVSGREEANLLEHVTGLERATGAVATDGESLFMRPQFRHNRRRCFARIIRAVR